MIKQETVCEHLSSTLSIEITKKYLKTKKTPSHKKTRQDTVILKPDKGKGVVVIDTVDYYESLNKLFSDTTKFKRLDAYPANTRFNTFQSYLRKLYYRNEISEEVYQENRLKIAKVSRTHGLPKIHNWFKEYQVFGQ